MKKQILFIFGTFILLLFLNFNILASEPVNLEVAKRAAEYHGESLFEKDLKICDHELMVWPWGEQAVYVFTLIEEGDYYPEPVYLDYHFLQGAYLVASGEKVEGYRMMAQAERYITIFVGATTDMPSFIKAYEGLPEHVMARGVLNYLSPDPLWIYGGSFRIFVAKDMTMEVAYLEREVLEDVEALEIHEGYTVILRDLGKEKVGAIPDYEQDREWEPFLSSDKVDKGDVLLPIQDFNVQDKSKKLPVEELSVYLDAEGCYPDSMCNILMYNIKMNRVVIPVEYRDDFEYPNQVLLFIAICCRTWDYTNRGRRETLLEWFVKGAKLIYKGLDTKANITPVWRKNVSRNTFFNKFAAEIDANYPVEVGGGDHDPLRNHSCVGIGYSIKNGSINILVHDGYGYTTKPVHVNYAELEGEHLGLVRIRPKGRKIYANAVPKVKGPGIAKLNMNKKAWETKIKVTSKNKVNAYFCASQMEFYDLNGKKKKKLSDDFARIRPPYGDEITLLQKFSDFSRGRCEFIFYLIDDNGDIQQKEYKVRLEHVIGRWKMNYQWSGKKAGSSTWTLYADGRFKSSSGQGGIWRLKNKSFTIRYATTNSAVYRGKVSSAYEVMGGTMSNNKGSSGTWSTKRLSDNPYGGKKQG